MAISFVGSKTFTHAATSAQSCSLTDLLDAAGSSATLQQNDLVVITYVQSAAATRTLAQCTPSGYTNAHASVVTASDTNIVSMAVSYKLMGAVPDTTVSIPASAATTSGVAVIVEAYRGVDTVNPVDVTATTASAINTGVANPPSVTPTTAGAWIVGAAGAAVAAGAVFTNTGNPGYSATTNHFRSATITSTTNDANAAMGIKTDWSSGAFDAAALGGSTSTNTGSWGAVSIALRPLLVLSPSLFSDSDTFSAATVSATYDLAAALLADADSFFAPTVGQVTSLTPSLFANSASFFAPTVAPGAAALLPSPLSDGDTFFSAAVAAGSVDLAPALVAASNSFHSPTIGSSYQLTPALYADADTFHAPVVTSDGGDLALLPSLFTNTSNFHSAAVSATLGLAPSLFVNAPAFPAPTATSIYALTPELVANAATLFAATVEPGPVALVPSRVANDNNFHPATVAITDDVTLLAARFDNVIAFHRAYVRSITGHYPLAYEPEAYELFGQHSAYPLAGRRSVYP